MNMQLQDKPCEKAAHKNFGKLFDIIPKLTYKVKEIGGDYYYEKMSREETMAKAFINCASKDKELRSQKDIDAYVRDNMNVKFPKDGPLWRIYTQEYNPLDQDTENTLGLTIFKAHHSFCDGVSVMCLCLSLSEEYSRDYFIKSTDAKWYEELFIKLTFPLQLFKVMAGAFVRTDTNFITNAKNSKDLSGNLNVCSSGIIDFRLMKALSKKIGVTINDIMTSALTCSMNTIFKEKGDKSEDFQMVIPANIRFKFYPSPDKVKLENKFAGLGLKVPLTKDMQSSYSLIQSVTKPLKNSLSLVYCLYASTYWSGILLPRFLPSKILESVTSKYTIGFSNTPGPIKPFFYYGA